MEVLIDSTIWSLALRRRALHLGSEEVALVEEWRRLVLSGDAVLIGPVRQEVLSGVKDSRTFDLLRSHLADFRQLAIEPNDYDRAASLYNLCRASGVAPTAIDMLICAVAERFGVPIFTTDRDFEHYARHLPIELHRPIPPREQ